MRKIIIYDAECVFCNRSIKFLLKGKPNKNIKFVSFNSEVSKKILLKLDFHNKIDSILFIEENRVFEKSTAILKIINNFTNSWRYLYYLIYLPKPIRDLLYKIISKNRYNIFGKNNSCKIFTAIEKEYFIN